jgi:two-component system response regulator NreC
MRIVLVAGEPAFRFGFKAVVEGSGDLQVVADAADARAGFQAIDMEKPDVVVMDVALKGINGIDATREVKRRAPGARVLLLAAWPRERDVLDGFAAGADGFALKTDSIDTLRQALRMVGHGQRYVSAEVRGLKLETAREVHRSRMPSSTLETLSSREREVLDLVVKGWRNREIARELCISIKTVDTHRTHINRKLHCTGAADIVRFAADNGLLRQAPSTVGTGGQARTIVVMVDDDQGLRDELLQDMDVQGYQRTNAPTASRALAELRESSSACLFVIEGADGRPAVRAIASLPQADADERLVAALDRAAARRLIPSGERGEAAVPLEQRASQVA